MFRLLFRDEKQRICFRIGSAAATSGSPCLGRSDPSRSGRGPRCSLHHRRQVDGPAPSRRRSGLGSQTHAGPASISVSRPRGTGEDLAGPEADRSRLSHRPLERRIVDLIRRKFGVVFHPASMRRWLTERGYSPQRPARKARQRNDDAIVHWVANDWPRIQKKRAPPAPTSS